MTGVHIRSRTLRGGAKRYDVRFRRGGRGFPLEHGGTFETQREARSRRDLIAGELAAGRDPRVALKPKVERADRLGRQVAAAYKASRIDLAIFPDSHLTRFNDFFGDRVVDEVSYVDVQAYVNSNRGALQPASLRKYLDTVRLIFDFAGLEPNPARDRRVKLPRIIHAEIVPPTARQFLALVDKVPAERRLPLVTMEQTGMAVGETCTLAWGDVDALGRQFRLKRSNVKGQLASRARWVQVPEWLMPYIEALCPLEDRTAERAVFGGTPTALGATMRRACNLAGIPLFSPHDLRHRRISLWHGQGVPTRELSARVGHANASMTLDVYSHVMPDDEIPATSLEALLVRHG